MIQPILNGARILLSASIPPELVDKPDVIDAHADIVAITRAVMETGGQLVFGGHPSITRLVWQAARNCAPHHGSINIYQAEYFRAMAPVEVHDEKVFGPIQWKGSGVNREDDLKEMRLAMCRQTDAAIFLGGRIESGGVGEELRFFKQSHATPKPYYLLGNWGGETRELIRKREAEEVGITNHISDSARKLIQEGAPLEFAIFIIIQDLLGRLD